jgi:IPT/TIG domain
MTKRIHRRVLLLAFAIGCSACHGRSPSEPTPAPPGAPSTPSTPKLTAISPSTGSTTRPTRVVITGTGFLAGATVTIDATALMVTVVDSGTIAAIAPAHAAGPADVVVTNPSGLGGTLTAAFTYSVEEPFTVTPSTDVVDAGGRMSVSWTAPTARSGDWIALCRVGQRYDDDWYDLTKGVTSGTLTVTAPTRPGQYEFRYLTADGFSDDHSLALAHSSPVTVR